MSQSAAQTSPEARTNGSHDASAIVPGVDASTADIERVFKLQQAHQFAVGKTTARERKEKLKRLLTAVMSRRQEIRDALYADFRKHPAEVDLTEVMPVTTEIKHAIGHLSKWMRPRRVKTPLSLFGSSSYIHYEPKGVVLVIAPWNFPVNLTFGPVISAVAAGNCVMLKPSEHTPHASAIIRSIIEDVFDESEVAVVEGGIETSTAALALPFNHIFFTGAPAIGKIVMAAASKHLASVTLELGGKSPTIIDETASVDAAAKRIAWAKFTNNGQICIAPDYLFVHESKKDEFLEKLGKHIESFYGLDARRSDSYARIVNHHHYQRLSGYLEDAKHKGATVAYGGQTEGSEDYIGPTVLTDVDPNADVMVNEIFGPLLPVYGYKSL
ncbi:MAG: aldehyde dehydrogenase family protein, partial [Deltaproteobacteria bacterium]